MGLNDVQIKMINNVAEYFDVIPLQVEKDYYQTCFLKAISEVSDNFIFKGGTSLSKCHHVINRFSEDIDISSGIKATQGERRAIYHAITDGIRFVHMIFLQ